MILNEEDLVKIEDYVNVLNEQSGLMISTLIDVDNAIRRKRKELSALDYCKCTEEPMWTVGGKCVTCNKPQRD